MRDSTFTLQALYWLNLDWEANEFMEFVADLKPNDHGALQIMYGIDGRRDLAESTRDDLSGTPERARYASTVRSTSARTTSSRRHPAAHATEPETAPPSLADRAVAGRVRRPGMA
jgi:hypothetical protein